MASPTAPTISSTGITAPSFAEVLAYLKAQYQAIYGADIYLGDDSQDGQFLGIIASAINDSNAAAVACYNAFSPATAQGNGLSSVVKINGIQRLMASASTADIRIVGVAGTQINNGAVGDDNGNRWAIPASVLIPSAGEITVTATCTTDGAIAAAANTITKILTPVFGWQTANNPTQAVEGAPVESDAGLRSRQSKSVAVPSLTIFEGVIGSVANLTGVTRIAGYENDTDTTDANGIAAHSIAVVVEGGDSTAIAKTIAEKKTPGTGTVGTISNTIIDSVGSSHIIKFSRPTEAAIHVALTIHGLTGYSASILPIIKQALVDYLNALPIGQDVIYSKLFVPANLDNQGYGSTYNITAMTIAKGAGTPGTSDIVIAYDEVAFGDVANISITVI